MPTHPPLFANRVGVVATMHHKEKVIAPLLAQALGMNVIVPEHFNTDVFGTFTREINRPGDQLETARLKAEKALTATGETVAIASEGAFGPHPSCPLIPCDREIVLLLDQTNAIEIVGQALSTETNFRHQVISSFAEAAEFSAKVGFPEHGLVVRPHPQGSKNQLVKGITTQDELFKAVTQALNQSCLSQAHIEADMRAMYNPTRMKTIACATADLIKKIMHSCPVCSWPGFEVVESISGLRCSACSLPTELTVVAVYHCKRCDFSQEVQFPNGLTKANPTYCAYCNP